MELVAKKFGNKKHIAVALYRPRHSVLVVKLQISSTMNNQTNRVELLKAVKSAVNAASFSTTEGRVKEAKAAVRDLMAYLDSLESAKPNASKKRKRKQKSGKATAATKVADKQEKAFHGKADGVVKPSTRKPKASVEAARKAAQDVSRHTGAESRAKRKAEMMAEAVASPAQVTSDDRVASLEAKLEQLTATLAVRMTSDVTPTANEVCFSDVPFDHIGVDGEF